MLLLLLLLPGLGHLGRSDNVTAPLYVKARDAWNDRQILEDLLKRYRFPDTSANISVGVQLRLEAVMSSTPETCIVQILLNQKWLEPRLRFENLRETLQPIRLHSLNYVWNPELILGNGLSVSVNGPDNIFVFPNGIVEFEQRLQVTLQSSPQLSSFPFDAKNCTLYLANADVRAAWSRLLSVETSRNLAANSGEWILVQLEAGHMKSVQIVLKRALLPWTITLFIPSLALVTVAFLALWCYEAGDRRQLTVTAISTLGVIILVLFSYHRSPPSTFLRASDVWYIAVMVCCIAMELGAIVLGGYALGQSEADAHSWSSGLHEEREPEKRRWLLPASQDAPYYSQVRHISAGNGAQMHKLGFLAVILLAFSAFCTFYALRYALPYYELQ